MLLLVWMISFVFLMGCAAQAHTVVHPERDTYLHHSDEASIGCPKPMLFCNGLQNKLFPVQSVEDWYQKVSAKWKDQNAEGKLFIKLWDVKHKFNKEMQLEAFEWLGNYVK